MQVAYSIFNSLIKAGPVTMLPIIIFIIAIIFRVKLGEAIKGAITVGVGFAGLKLVVGFMTDNLGPATTAMVKNFGLHFNVLDVGFGATASIGWSSPIVPVTVFCILGINILLLLLNKTNTLSVDIWNYHHCLTVGAVTYFLTNNFLLGVISAVCTGVVVFKFADWASPVIKKYYKIDGLTTPALHTLTGMLLLPFNMLIDRIPVINKINFDMKSAKKYLGVFGEPVMLGLILGCGIGALAGYNPYKIFGLGVDMATVMYLLPKVAHIFVEGIKPISDQARTMTQSKLKGRDILIGIDPAVLLGDPAVITTSLLMVPILLGLAVILPGNRLLPFGDLGAISYKVALIVAITNGNIFRSLILSSILMVATLYCGTATAPAITATGKALGVKFGTAAAGTQLINSLAGTSLPSSFIMLKTFTGNLYITIPLFIIGFGLIWFFAEKAVKKSKSNAETIK